MSRRLSHQKPREQEDGDLSLFRRAANRENFSIDSDRIASRIYNGMTKLPPGNLLLLLSDRRKHGMSLLYGIFSQCCDPRGISDILLPIIGIFLDSSLQKPLFRDAKNIVLTQIFGIHLFVEALSRELDHLDADRLEIVCTFVEQLLQTSIALVKHPLLMRLTNCLKNTGHSSALKLSRLFVDPSSEALSGSNSAPSQFRSRSGTAQTIIAPTAPKMRGPGGRHPNDFNNFRLISVLPTIQEVMCPTRAYLPFAGGSNRFLRDDESHYLDSLFRLLRHDTIQPLRDAMQLDTNGTISFSGRTRIYSGLKLVNVLASTPQPPVVVISFTLPEDVKSMTKDKKKDFWEKGSLLNANSLICLRNGLTPLIFATVGYLKLEWLMHEQSPMISISFGHQSDLETVLRTFPTLESSSTTDFNFVAVSVGSFRNDNVLTALQRTFDLPLKEYLLPPRPTTERNPFPAAAAAAAAAAPQDLGRNGLDIPGYLRVTGGRLPVIRRGGGGGESIELHITRRRRSSTVGLIQEHTTLDASQANALYHALTNKVALIQGPPGTGKSFVGDVLARAILLSSTNVKILAICFTNHALDQFLESLLDSGVTGIVRIGSRSKSAKLQAYNLNVLAGRMENDPPEPQERVRYAQLRQECDEYQNNIEDLTGPMFGPLSDVSWETMESYLEEEMPGLHHQFLMPLPEDEYEYSNKKMNQPNFLWDLWIKGRSISKSHQILIPSIAGKLLLPYGYIWSMPLNDRLEMVRKWMKSRMDQLLEELGDYEDAAAALRTLKQERKRKILREARVIGATTSGAAGAKELIASVGAEVVIVEEAGEVLEAHIVSSLTENIQHLILIGDHLQLRPKVQTYDLTMVANKGFELDKSLFERLVVDSGIKPALLNIQRRMRPEISSLIRGTYPTLVDHTSVQEYPSLNCFQGNLFFLDHSRPEDSTDRQISKRNSYEASVCVQIARILLLNGYSPRNIVILTPYLGQLMTIRATMREKLHDIQALVSEIDKEKLEENGFLDDYGNGEIGAELGSAKTNGTSFGANVACSAGTAPLSADNNRLRVSTVDNYQGEESDHVIVSLVRSNSDGSIGFLKECERINVLLSRARMSMFLVGNATTYRNSRQGGGSWEPYLNMFESSGTLVSSLPSVCQLHQDTIMPLKIPYDFVAYRPNGGCTRECTFRMNCGHVCPQRCHSVDREHAFIKCMKPCRRFPADCPYRHKCPKYCHEDCGTCLHQFQNYKLPCGHSRTVTCHDVRSSALIPLIPCLKTDISVTMQRCGHTIKMSCNEARKPKDQWFCTEICSELLACGHPCGRKCGECARTGNHAQFCANQCARIMS